MSVSDIARRLESLTSALSIGGRTLLSIDTNPVPDDWRHITKIDPEGEKTLPLAFPLYLSHSSAVSVGGSRDVTDRNTEETFDLVTAAQVPAFHEPSAASHVTQKTRDDADFIAIPEVLNGDSKSLVGTLGEGIDYVREDLGPQMVADKLPLPLNGALGDRISNFAAAWMLEENVFEAYIIMNVDSAAAREANVTEDDLLSPQEARERALAAEYHLESEFIYLEYSGTFGGDEAVDILEAVDDAITWPRILYGGGLDSRENVNKVLDAGADAVVVGNVFHEIAQEEADLYERAHDELNNPDRDEIREWLDETIDIEETNAGRYLSTIPDLPEPEQQAARYLTTTIQMASEVRAIADKHDDPDEAALRAALDDGTVPGETALAEVLDGNATDIARRLALGLLADHFDVALEDTITARHLALEL